MRHGAFAPLGARARAVEPNLVSGFQEHFLDKYFGYRRRYVDHIVREAPHRGSLAVLSELARLSFSLAGNALCALIFWTLAVSAASRAGGFGVWVVVFGALALLPTWFGLLCVAGIVTALRDRRRVQERTAGATKAQLP